MEEKCYCNWTFNGFIEPLESTGLLSTYEFLLPFVSTLRRNGIVNQWDRDAYNFSMSQMFNQLAQFVALHYAISPRCDSDYWMDITERSRISPELNSNPFGIHEFTHTAKARYKLGDWQQLSGFQCIAAGMNYSPVDAHLQFAMGRLSGIDCEGRLDYLQDVFTKTQQQYQSYASQCPSAYNYLKKTIHAEDS